MLGNTYTRFQQQLRERELASADRAGAYARRAAFRTQLDYVRANWRMLVLAIGVIVAPAPLTLFFPGNTRWFLLGLLVGLGSAGLYHLIVLLSGSANVLLGDVGEQRTRDVFRQFQKRGWKVIHGFRTDDDEGDIDTIAIGPGGVVIVETKWSSSSWSQAFMQHTLDRAIRQALRGCVRVRAEVGDVLRDVAPVPVVTLWSAYDGEPRPRETRANVMVGHKLAAWLDTLPADALSPPEIERVWQQLEAVASRRQLTDRDGRPLPTTPGEHYRAVMTYAGGFFAAPYLLSVVPRDLVVGAIIALAVVTPLIARMLKPRGMPRRFALGASACCAFIVVGAAAFTTLQLVSG